MAETKEVEAILAVDSSTKLKITVNKKHNQQQSVEEVLEVVEVIMAEAEMVEEVEDQESSLEDVMAATKLAIQ